VRIGPGMTLYSIAKANGMTVQQLAQANGIAQPYTVSTGRVLRIPGAATAQLPTQKIKPLVAEEQTAQVNVPVHKSGSTYAVQSGDTLYSLGRKFGVSPFTIASANGLGKDKALSLGQKIKIPGGGTVTAAQTKAPVVDQENISDNTDQQVADATPATKPAALALPKPTSIAQDVPAIPSSASSDLAMRWPVRGKVISEFGTKPSGLKNEGINISVPEGTSVRAAESGVVAYAGNELKGYGNLILIRHSGGYVTAYAHAKSLNVKRGDTVKRGDVIAVAGQTGAVQSPQLHFEVRKGAVALDPTKYLSASTASN
jgi:murein DD-endopeptidase MepM/ murein hydrolase activator NlpD